DFEHGAWAEHHAGRILAAPDPLECPAAQDDAGGGAAAENYLQSATADGRAIGNAARLHLQERPCLDRRADRCTGGKDDLEAFAICRRVNRAAPTPLLAAADEGGTCRAARNDTLEAAVDRSVADQPARLDELGAAVDCCVHRRPAGLDELAGAAVD